jgi:hypothetical protein
MKLKSITESYGSAEIIEHLMRYLRVTSQTTGDPIEQTLDDFKNHVFPDLMREIEERIHMEQR